MAPQIEVNGLWKRYGLPIPDAVRGTWRRLSGKNALPDSWALADVSFAVEPGETLGIIGRNGAGKSTLLKVLAGVSPPTKGKVEISGSMFPMIELNAGINADLTGEENILLLGTIMGFTKQEVEARYDRIADFTELGKWLKRPVWQYSSGMKARLGFGVAVNVDADILLVDEILSVGDLSFKKKCYSFFEKLSYEGTSIVFVSHNIRQVERMCDRVIYLEDGKIFTQGDPSDVCFVYNQEATSDYQDNLKENLGEKAQIESSDELVIRGVAILDTEGNRIDTLKPNSEMIIRIEYDALEPLEDLYFGVQLLTSEMVKLTNFQLTPENSPISPYCLEGKGTIDILVRDLPFNPDCYSVGMSVKSKNGRRILRGSNLAQFCVEYDESTRTQFGLIQVEAEWRVTS